MTRRVPPGGDSLPVEARADLSWAVSLAGGGDGAAATAACERARAVAPFHPAVLFVAAALALDRGIPAQTRDDARLLLCLEPAHPRGWQALGRAWLLLGAAAPALTAFGRARVLGLALIETACDGAPALARLGRAAEALTALDAALNTAQNAALDAPLDAPLDAVKAPAVDLARIQVRRADLLLRLGRPASALEAAEAALALAPGDPEAGGYRVDSLLALHRPADGAAWDALAAAVTRRPGETTAATEAILRDTLDRGARALREAGREKTVAAYGALAVRGFPASPAAWTRLALAWWWAGASDDADRALARARMLAPEDPEVLWLGMLLALAPAHADEGTRTAAWERHRRAALALAPLVDAPPPALSGFDPLALGYPFYAAYHGPVDLDAQRHIGTVLSRAQTAWAATQAPPRSMPPPRDDRLRVVLVSGFWRAHTVCKLFRTWISDLDRRRFRVEVLSLGPGEDADTRDVAARADAFHACPTGSRAALAVLRGLAPDIVLYPELGMHHDTLRLAALRLAPVQAMAWGHPVTSGLPSIDLFLSSDLMEPPRAEEAYTERLIRLPGLSIRYEPPFLPADHDPEAPAVRAATRRRWGLAPDTPLLLSLQTHPKYAPQDDALLARVMAALPEARLALFEARPPVPPHTLRERLTAALRAHGATPERQLLWLPPLSLDDYRGINLAGDLFLDTPAWSGGNSALEAVVCGLPILTCPGKSMWSRHSAALLTLLGVSETIVPCAETYVTTAVRLVQDPSWRHALVNRAAARRDAVFADPMPGRALSDILEAAARRALRGHFRQSLSPSP